MLITIIYGSTATREMTSDDLLQILKESKAWNSKHNITGLLLYKDGNFLQVLEGEEADVDEVYSMIHKDDRHRSVLQILRRPIQERTFAEWEMGFVNVDDLNPDDLPDNFSDFLTRDIEPSSFSDDAAYAYTFLSAFRDISR